VHLFIICPLSFCAENNLDHKLSFPTSERAHVIQEAHTSLVSSHFGVRNTMAHMQRFFIGLG
jgi:hypothetical protein